VQIEKSALRGHSSVVWDLWFEALEFV